MSTFKSIDPSSISQGEVHGHLLSAVAPRPIAFASTIDADGNVNLSPFSFFNVFSSNPPIMIFSPARRGRDNTTKDTFENVKQIPEVTINIVNHPIVEQMSLTSTEYETGVNEFVKAGLTQVASQKVKPPYVGESPAAFECVVEQIIELGGGAGSGNLIICKVVMIHLNEKYLNEKGHLDTPQMDLVGRMGGIWYSRANGKALFEIPKPLRTKGIGVDQLPESVRNSEILTGNNLGRLGNLETLPNDEDIEKLKSNTEVAELLESEQKSLNSFHQLAKKMLEHNETDKAMGVLLIADRLF